MTLFTGSTCLANSYMHWMEFGWNQRKKKAVGNTPAMFCISMARKSSCTRTLSTLCHFIMIVWRLKPKLKSCLTFLTTVSAVCIVESHMKIFGIIFDIKIFALSWLCLRIVHILHSAKVTKNQTPHVLLNYWKQNKSPPSCVTLSISALPPEGGFQMSTQF